MLAWGLALLIAAGGMLLSASGAQAASKRGAVLVKDISPGNPKRVGSSNPNGLTNVAGTLFFAGFDRKHGTELWRSDGTRRGTRMVKDINPNPPPKGFSSDPFALTAVGRTLYFVAKDGIHGEALWRSNGTARGTRMVKDIDLAPGGDRYLGPPTDLAGTLFYVVGDQAHSQLWRSDGTRAGTTLVKQFIDLRNLTAVGGILYFAANDGVHGTGLWRSDGTASGTVLIKKLDSFVWLTDAAGTLFFTGDDGTHAGLWRSDGTEAGTTLVKQLGEPLPNDLTAVGGTLYFTIGDYVDNGQLWRSDGTEAGTTPITSVGPTPEADALYPSLTAVAGTLYFVRNGPPAGYLGGTLMRTDGTPSGTRELRSSMIPRQLTAVGNTLYFEGYDTKNGNELWRSDGTSTGTRLVRDIRRGERSSRPQIGTAVGRTLFFSANDGVHGTELWRAGPKPCKTAKGNCKKG